MSGVKIHSYREFSPHGEKKLEEGFIHVAKYLDIRRQWLCGSNLKGQNESQGDSKLPH